MNKEFVSRNHMDIQNNIEKLKQLISRSKEERGAFSRNGYGFAIVSSEKYDAIPKEDLTILEKEYSVSLPDEYKAFVTEIANGGVHPMCGLFTVQDSLALNRMRKEDLDKSAGKIIVSRFLDCAGYDEYSERNCREWLEEFEVKAFGRKPMLDDYFSTEVKKKEIPREESVFIDYIEWKTFPDEDEYWGEYREGMMKHILLLSYEDYYRLEIGLVLDGKYKGEVVYIPHEFGSHLILTHMSFLDWFIGYYTHELDHHQGRYIFFW